MALRLERSDDTQSLYYQGVSPKTTYYAESVKKTTNVTSVIQRFSASRIISVFIHQVLIEKLGEENRNQFIKRDLSIMTFKVY